MGSVTFARSDADRRNEMELGIPADLIGIIGTYTIPTVTYHLVILAEDVAIRSAYSDRGFWRDKVVYETRGLVFDDQVIQENRSSYHTYYRIINQREFGAAGILEEGDTLYPIAEVVFGAWGDARQFYVATPEGLTIYRDATSQDRYPTLRRVIFADWSDHSRQTTLVLLEDGDLVTISDTGKRSGYHKFTSEPIVAVSTCPVWWAEEGPQGQIQRIVEGVVLTRDGTVWSLEGTVVVGGATWINRKGIFDRVGEPMLVESKFFEQIDLTGRLPRFVPEHEGLGLVPMFQRWGPGIFLGVDGVARRRITDGNPGILQVLRFKAANTVGGYPPVAVIY